MRKRITINGVDMGVYRGGDEAAILDAYARDAGYKDWADLQANLPSSKYAKTHLEPAAKRPSPANKRLNAALTLEGVERVVGSLNAAVKSANEGKLSESKRQFKDAKCKRYQISSPEYREQMRDIVNRVEHIVDHLQHMLEE